jgi:glycosyltransferase involved in cell wall biosynthesis
MNNQYSVNYHLTNINPFMPTNPLVSVIIPCYNQAQFLTESITSVITQSYQNWEIIIVNDGSTDDSRIIANQLISTYPQYRIKLIEQINSGVANARNTGISAAKGEYILPLDADDILTDYAIDKLLNISFKSNHLSVAFGSFQMFGVENDIVFSADVYSPENIKNFNMISPCSMFHRSIWEKVGGYNERIEGYEDWEFWLRCHLHNVPFIGTREVILNYRRYHSSIVLQHRIKHEYLYATIINYNQEFFGEDQLKYALKMLDNHGYFLNFEEDFNEINLITFPDWNQNEDNILYQLEELIQCLLLHPDRNQINLFIDCNLQNYEQNNLLISTALMNILSHQDLDLSDDYQGEICLFDYYKVKGDFFDQINGIIKIKEKDMNKINYPKIIGKTEFDINELKKIRFSSDYRN